jgi:hypothetical protein
MTGLQFDPAAVIGTNSIAVNWASLYGVSTTIVGLALGTGRAMTIDTAAGFKSSTSFTVSGTGSIAITDFAHFDTVAIGLSGTRTITTGCGLRIVAQVFTNITDYYPLYIGGNASTTQGSVHRPSLQIGSVTKAYGGGDGVLSLSDAVTAPTASPTAAVVLHSISGQLNKRGLMGVNEPVQSTLVMNQTGSAYASSVTETALSSAVFAIPANALIAGAVLRITAYGVYGTAAATTPTFQMRCRWGGVAGVLLGDSGADAMGLGVTNLGWNVDFLIRVVSIGATGTFECQGRFDANTTATLSNSSMMSNAAVITVDTTAAKDLVLTGQWGTNSASNTLTGRQFLVERVA